jgi:hypothetical protein
MVILKVESHAHPIWCSAGAAPLLYEPCSVAWMGSMMRREGHALRLGPRSAACVDRIHRISSVLDLSWYLHACRPFNIMRASLIPFNHQSWSQCKPSTLLLVRGFVMTKNGIINVPHMENTSHAGYHDFVKKTTFNHN